MGLPLRQDDSVTLTIKDVTPGIPLESVFQSIEINIPGGYANERFY